MKIVKKIWMIAALSGVLIFAPTKQSHAIVWAVVKAALVKVIKAMDLAVQRLQNKTIWLQNAQQTLENTLSKVKLDEISDWTSKHKQQYQKYYEELSKIKNAVANYKRVRDIMTKQLRIVQEYKRAFELFKQDKNFSAEEIAYMTRVYTGMIRESLRSLDQLLQVVRISGLTMTDGKRLQLIAKAADGIDTVLADLRLFNRQNIKLSLQRARDIQEVKVLKEMYGVQ
ncbi:conjugal transfer protein TraI [Niabella ginsengisoli]|uniref:Conjugal transfer protein TraI n=1 Tax=Niabella ginsengisoli TaxID=522298 RepID=A0ABS9SHT8_9BACT|nr:conjugal transfer protein TraI [Niabella ginsengisoli]MCH5597937.1 conjugal transfer protein TraI [Niabella ginsengisoli]